MRYKNEVNSMKIRLGEIAESSSIYSFGLMWNLVYELIFNNIFIPPNLQLHFSVSNSVYIFYDFSFYFGDSANFSEEKKSVLTYNVSNFISLLFLLRSYHLIRLMYAYSYWSE